MTTPLPATPRARPAPGQPLTATLRLLGTTDLHCEILAYDYFADRPTSGTGLALAAGLVRRLRAEVPNCLLFDNGDFLQGNPLSDWAAETLSGDPGSALPHPMMAAMNALGYDAATLGNHEFNYGLPTLRAALDRAEFPVVSANVLMSRGDGASETLVPPWTILTRQVLGSDDALHPLRIGVIGLAPPQIAAWERFTLHGALTTIDIVDAAREQVPILKAAGAEIVVVLCHAGIGADDHTRGMENASVPLAAVPGIDAILMGHTHGVFPGPETAATAAVDPVAGTLHGKPAVMAGFHGSHIGVIDLGLIRDGAGWHVAQQTVRAEPVTGAAVTGAATGQDGDPAILDAVRPAHEAALAHSRRAIAHTRVPLSTHFAFVAPVPALALLADVLTAHAREVLPSALIRDLPLLAAVAPYMAGGKAGPDYFVDIAAGPLAVRHASELYPFPNGLCVVRLTGRDLTAWLEVSARALSCIVPGTRDQPLRQSSVPSYNFDVIHGLRYIIDPTQPDGARISGLTLADGTPIDPAAPVLVCTNGYRAGGGGGFSPVLNGAIVHSGRRPLRDLLILGLRRAGEIAPRRRQVWRFARIPETSAWFDTGRGAASHLPDAADPPLTPLGTTADGFERYRIDFDSL